MSTTLAEPFRITSVEQLETLCGQPFTAPVITVYQHQVDEFAEATGDNFWAHIDLDRAASELPRGKTIIHNSFIYAVLPVMIDRVFDLEALGVTIINRGADSIRFHEDVSVGSALQATVTLRAISKTKESEAEGYNISFECTMYTTGLARPVCNAIIILGAKML